MKNQVKYLQKFFYDLLNDYGRVYVLIRHSGKSFIGKRGFTEEEKKKGLVLVFNEQNYKGLEWTEEGDISATLGFGAANRAEKCFLHSDDIVSVFSPYGKIRMDRWDIWESPEEIAGEKKEPARERKRKTTADNVVEIERFRKRKTEFRKSAKK
jgi:hypothetical protein